jgi:hypothetical protein
VRHAGTVGGDDANVVSTHPALPVDGAAPAPGTRDAGRRGDVPRDRAAGDATDSRPAGDVSTTVAPAHEPAIATRSADDSDVGWGDREAGSNDDRLHQDKPPHW